VAALCFVCCIAGVASTRCAETLIKFAEHQRKLLKELDESFKNGGYQHSPNDLGWFEKAKSFFS